MMSCFLAIDNDPVCTLVIAVGEFRLL